MAHGSARLGVSYPAVAGIGLNLRQFLVPQQSFVDYHKISGRNHFLGAERAVYLAKGCDQITKDRAMVSADWPVKCAISTPRTVWINAVKVTYCLVC